MVNFGRSQLAIYIHLRSYGAHPIGCISSTSFDVIAKAFAAYQLHTSFVGAVVNDLKTDRGEGAGEVFHVKGFLGLRRSKEDQQVCVLLQTETILEAKSLHYIVYRR